MSFNYKGIGSKHVISRRMGIYSTREESCSYFPAIANFLSFFWKEKALLGLPVMLMRVLCFVVTNTDMLMVQSSESLIQGMVTVLISSQQHLFILVGYRSTIC